MKKFIITFSIMLFGIIGLLSMAYNTGSGYSGNAYTGGAYSGNGYSGDVYSGSYSGGVNTGEINTGDNYSSGSYTVMYYYQENGRYTDGTMATRREGTINETVYVTSSDKTPKESGYEFDSSANNVLSGKIKADGSLILKVYFKERNTGNDSSLNGSGGGYGYGYGYGHNDYGYGGGYGYGLNNNYNTGSYTVMYYYQENGRYTDGTMATRREGTINETVYVTSSDKTPKESGYEFDSSANNVLSGKIKADGSLILKVYFKEKNNGTNTGSNKTGSNYTGNNNTGSNKTGSNYTGNNNTGSNKTGNNYTGNNITGSNKTGSNYTGNNNTGSNKTGSNYTGNNITGSATYTVKYYYQAKGKYSEDLSQKKTRSGIISTTAKVTNSDKEPQITGYVFDSSANNVLSGKIKADGSLILKVYFKEKNNGTNTGSNKTGSNYTGNNNTGSNKTGNNYTGNNITGSATYTVKYYYQAKGKYSEDLSQKKTRSGTISTTAKVTNSDKEPQITGYEFDSSANNVLSGKIKADGSLILKVYFKEKNKDTSTSQSYSKELQDAYNWAYSNGIIFESNIDAAGMYNKLPNPEMRFILLNFANYLGLNEDLVSKRFGNLFEDEGSSANYERFATALSRVLWGNKYDGGNPYYINHLNALKSAGIISQNVNSYDNPLRGYVLLALMSSEVDCDDELIALACALGYDSCPEVCRPDAELKNQLTKTVEYKANEVSRKTVFSGTYKALKDTSFNSIHIEKLFEDECRYPENNVENRDSMRFYLTIDGKMINTEFAIKIDECDNGIGVWFDEIKVKKGSSINVKIEGENIRQTGEILDKKYKVTLKHSENFNMEVWGEASANLAPIKLVDNNEFIIQTLSGQDTVYLKEKNSKLAEFLIKPSKGKSTYLDELELEINQPGINDNDISLIIDGIEYEFKSSSMNNGDKHIICQPDIEIPSEGVSVKVILEQELGYDDYIISTKIKSINGKTIDKTFSKRFVSVLAYISKQENKMDYTKYTLGVEKYDDNYSIETLCMLTGSSGAGVCLLGENWDDGPFEDGYTFIVANSSLSQPINYITYSIKDTERSSWADNISIERKDYPDYFKVNGVDRKVYGNSSNSSDDNSSNNGSGYLGGTDNANYTGTGNGGYNGNTQNSYSAEMLEAYGFAYKNRITTANTIEGAKMYSPLTRGAMAKMLANYAINVLGKKPNILKGTPKFNDVTEKLNKQYDNAIVNIYQLGIMGQNAKNFRASDPVTRAEFATALSRMVYGTKDGNPYYETHMNKLKEEGIINNSGNPKAVVLRGYAMQMLMRSVK